LIHLPTTEGRAPAATAESRCRRQRGRRLGHQGEVVRSTALSRWRRHRCHPGPCSESGGRRVRLPCHSGRAEIVVRGSHARAFLERRLRRDVHVNIVGRSEPSDTRRPVERDSSQQHAAQQRDWTTPTPQNASEKRVQPTHRPVCGADLRQNSANSETEPYANSETEPYEQSHTAPTRRLRTLTATSPKPDNLYRTHANGNQLAPGRPESSRKSCKRARGASYASKASKASTHFALTYRAPRSERLLDDQTGFWPRSRCP
jgi:hypothetical protein